MRTQDDRGTVHCYAVADKTVASKESTTIQQTQDGLTKYAAHSALALVNVGTNTVVPSHVPMTRSTESPPLRVPTPVYSLTTAVDWNKDVDGRVHVLPSYRAAYPSLFPFLVGRRLSHPEASVNPLISVQQIGAGLAYKPQRIEVASFLSGLNRSLDVSPPLNLHVASPAHSLEAARTCLPSAFGGVDMKERSWGEDSWESSKVGKEKVALGANAYKQRNVYKSILRRMFCYVRQNRGDLIRALLRESYKMHEIEHAFYKISCCMDCDKIQGKKHNAQELIKKFAHTFSIYTYILRDTLKSMIDIWKQGLIGKVSKDNLKVYQEVCQGYHQAVLRLIAQSTTRANAL